MAFAHLEQSRHLGSQNLSKWLQNVLHDGGNHSTFSDRELPLDYSTGLAEDWVRNQTSSVLARKDAKWRNDPPSDKQLAALAMFGIRDRNLTKGDASDMLRIKFNERSRSFAVGSRMRCV